MKLVNYSWLIFMTCVINKIISYDESIGFTNPESWDFVPSYWHGFVSSSTKASVFREGITLQAYIVHEEGLLIYIIDDKYRTLWLEVEKGVIIGYYYKWEIKSREMIPIKFDQLCGKNIDNYLKLHIELSMNSNKMKIECNGQKDSFMYNGLFLESQMGKQYIRNMRFPVPKTFQSNSAHIWLGNVDNMNSIPTFNRVISVDQFEGAIYELKIRGIALKISSIGEKIGKYTLKEMMHCKKGSYCLNRGKCLERMRNKTECNCFGTKYLGDDCNKQYCAQFDGKTFAMINLLTNPKLMSFVFKVTEDINSEQTLFTLIFRNSFIFEISLRQNLELFMKWKKANNETSPGFKSHPNLYLNKNRDYIIVIKRDSKVFKISFMHPDTGKLEYETTMKIPKGIFPIKNIKIGGSVSSSPPKFFVGQISNLVFKEGKELKSWNEDKNFNKLPKCYATPKSTTKMKIKEKVTLVPKGITPSMSSPNMRKNKESSSGSGAIVALVMLVILLLGIIVVLVVIIIRNKKPNIPEEPKPTEFTPMEASLSTNTQNNNNGSISKSHLLDPIFISPVPTYIPTDRSSSIYSETFFKPPYKAKSVSYGLGGDTRSGLSNGTLATLVSPEDFHTVKEESSSSSSITRKDPSSSKVDPAASHHASSPTLVDTHPHYSHTNHRGNRSATHRYRSNHRSSHTNPHASHNNNIPNYNLSATLPASHNNPHFYSATDSNKPNSHVDNRDDASLDLSIDRYNTLATERSVARVMWKKRRFPSHCSIDR